MKGKITKDKGNATTTECRKVEEVLRETRKSGINIIGNVLWGTHLCQFYRTKKDLIDILVPYFKAGLENNEFCMWVTSDPISEEEAKEVMKKAVPNFNKYLKGGQMKIIPHTKWYLKGGSFNLLRVLNAWTNKLNQALAKGYDGIRITGNTAWLEKRDWRNFTDYEEEVNKAIGKCRMIVICTYCLDKCGASEIIDVVDNHQFALIRREGKWEVIKSGKSEKAEEQIHYQASLLKNVNDSIISVDMNGTIVYWNKGSEKMFGQKAEEALGKHISFIYPQKFKDLASKKIKEILQKGTLSYEAPGIRKDGTLFLRNVSVSVLKDEKGQSIGFIGISTDLSQIKKLEKAKKVLTEKVAKLTKKIPLTQNERLVFYGLVKYPLLNDLQLSEKIGVKRSTVTAIKNKLKKQGFYSTYIVPNFELLGCELMCILAGKTPVEKNEERRKLGIIEKVMNSPEVVFDIGTDNDFLSLIISKNFVEVKKLLDFVSAIYDKHNMNAPNPLYFPFATTKVMNFLNFSTLLKDLFDLDIKEESEKHTKPAKGKLIRMLTVNEKIILYALVKYPDLNDTEIARITKISRQTVSQTKKSLLKENFLNVTNIPDMKRLGLELLVLCHSKFNIDSEYINPPLWMVAGERESLSIFIFKNYTEYRTMHNKLNEIKEKLSMPESVMSLFPIEQIKFQKMDFASIIKKIFDLKTSF